VIKKSVFAILIFLLGFLPASAQGYIQNIGSCPLPNKGWQIEVSGNYAFIACDSSGLQIADITDPEDPFIAASYSTPNRAFDLFLTGDLAFIADFSSLQIVDISDPLSPDSVGGYQSDYVFSVHASGDYAYMGRGYNVPAFEILDISDPSDPVFLSGLAFWGGVRQLYYSQGYLYVLSNLSEPYSNYLRAVDVSDPLDPFVAGSVQIAGTVEIPGDIMVSGDYAYIANRSNGLQIVDISDPENMEVIGSCDTPGDATGIFVNDPFATIADYYSGIQIVGIVNPTNPFVWDEGFTGDPAIAVFGTVWDLIYVTTTDSLVIFQHPGDDIDTDLTNPREFSLLQNYPNPFNSSTVINYSLYQRSDVRTDIYNILGQKVATLLDRNKEAGHHGITWNADTCPSGVYFARVTAGSKSESLKLVLLR
jgi:hypothetical protein